MPCNASVVFHDTSGCPDTGERHFIHFFTVWRFIVLKFIGIILRTLSAVHRKKVCRIVAVFTLKSDRVTAYTILIIPCYKNLIIFYRDIWFLCMSGIVDQLCRTVAVAMPLVSAGNIVNIKVPRAENQDEMIYENARRLVIGSQVDPCDAQGENANTFAFMYKQSFETQGESSDMFIKINKGFSYDTFSVLDGREVTNISAQNEQTLDDPSDYTTANWSTDNLDDNTWENGNENTFSPRIFLRGDDIFTGFEYKPLDKEMFPSNFHTNLYVDGVWSGPYNVTKVVKGGYTTEDARFFTTEEGSISDVGLTDLSNPDVLFVTWGTIENGTPEGIYYSRLVKTNGVWNQDNWEAQKMLAAREGTTIQEKEVESFASPDGTMVYSVWLQETEEADYDASDRFKGLDSWFGRLDYNVTVAP
jgi:hypothetical protein